MRKFEVPYPSKFTWTFTPLPNILLLFFFIYILIGKYSLKKKIKVLQSVCLSVSHSVSRDFFFFLNLLGCSKHVAFDTHPLFLQIYKKERDPPNKREKKKGKHRFLVSRSMGTKPNGGLLPSSPHFFIIFFLLLFLCSLYDHHLLLSFNPEKKEMCAMGRVATRHRNMRHKAGLPFSSSSFTCTQPPRENCF